MPRAEDFRFWSSVRRHPTPSGLAPKNPCFWHPEAISGRFLTDQNRRKRKDKGRLRFSRKRPFMEAAGIEPDSRFAVTSDAVKTSVICTACGAALALHLGDPSSRSMACHDTSLAVLIAAWPSFSDELKRVINRITGLADSQ
jgi:hypothetical protein